MEGRGRDAHLAVEQGGLDAHLEASDRLLVERRLQGDRVVAAALEAGCRGTVEHHVFPRPELESQPWSQRAPTVVQGLHGRLVRREVDRLLAMLLVVHGVAGAGRQGEAGRSDASPPGRNRPRATCRGRSGRAAPRCSRQRQTEEGSDRPVGRCRTGRTERERRASSSSPDRTGRSAAQREEPDAEQALVGQRVHVAQAPFAEGIGAGYQVARSLEP